MSDPIVIVAAKRSAIGSFLGSLSGVPAVDIAVSVTQNILEDTKLTGSNVDEVIMGHVLTAGLGQNTARQVSVKAGLDQSIPAMTINQVCGSGLRSIALGYQAIQADDARIVLAGGMENMSLSMHAGLLRPGVKMGEASLVDTMISDGLTDAFHQYHMGITAENIAEKFGISRDEQDQFAAQSQQRAEKAITDGKFKDEIVPIIVKQRKKEITFDADEFPRAGTTAEGLSGLRTAFKKDGTVTAGNASGLNDGAAAVLMMPLSEAEKRGLEPLAKIVSWATAGVDPAIMGTGPIPASQKALDKAGWSVDDLDLVESNEAFAAQACCVLKALKLDPEKVNVNGGAIALGHPIGASGARVAVTLLHEMQKRDVKKGLATLCIGGGMGIAMCFERV